MNTEIKLIGLTGTNAAGKGEAAAFFIEHGYVYFSLSDLIREELQQKQLEITRDNLIKTGNRMREDFGPDILARRILERVKDDSVIDSIRNPHEIQHLRSHPNFVLLALDAPVEIRYERAQKRGRNESAASLRAFIHKESEEMTDQATAQQLKTCMQMANFTVINDGTLDDLQKQLEAFL
ncbi:MAG: AAA family ATPase [Candidatus Aminicenantes bacterium]|nr:AAA family ATPase [Candidatus Aminicenantes bacterium]